MAPSPLILSGSILIAELPQELNVSHDAVRLALSRIARRHGFNPARPLVADDGRHYPPQRTWEAKPPHVNELKARKRQAS